MGTVKDTKPKLWNKNFFLLWQGQLVSVLGDVIYMIALDFWILEKTGSTGLMGLLSALTMLPRVVIGPFAGVFVDRYDRKKFIVITDFIRGIFVTFVGIAAIGGFIQVWMVFVVGITSGICGAFFNPAMSSVTPDIVHESKIVKANSVTSLARNGMEMIGSAVGGIIYITIGAPYMFLFNGISYLFSAFTEIFISVPKVEAHNTKVTFAQDFKEGFKFLMNFRVIRKMFLSASFLNLFTNSAFVLLVPYFKEMTFLGEAKYGFAMTALALGGVVGSILLSVFNIKKEYKFKLLAYGIILQNALLIGFMLTDNYYLMLVMMFMGFIANTCVNTIINSSIILTIPQNMRGKVLAIISTVSMGLIPIGKVAGGVLGEIFSIRLVMIGFLLLSFITGLFTIKVKNLNRLIEFNSEEDSIEELMKC